jgi:predicted negative regulator of RcsB-dependent stress response
MPLLPRLPTLSLQNSRWLRVLALIAWMLAAGAPLQAAEQVAVRVGEHPGFGRLVFEWTSPVGYSATIENDNLVLRFERPFAGALDTIARRMTNYVTQPALVDDDKTLVFPLKTAFGLKSYVDGRTVVVDLVNGGKPPAAPQGSLAQAPTKALEKTATAQPVVAAKPAAEKPAAEKSAPEKSVAAQPAEVKPAETASAPSVGPALAVRVGDHPGFGRLVFDWPRNVDYDIAQDGDKLNVKFAAPARIDVDALTPKLPKTVLSFAAQSSDAGLAVAMTVPEGARLRHFRNGPSIVVDVLADVAEPAADKAMSQLAAKQPDAKPENKVEPKAAPQVAAAKPDAKPEAKSETKPDAKAVDTAMPKYALVPDGPIATAPPQSLRPTPANAAPAATPATTAAAGGAPVAAGAPLAQAPIAARKLVISTLGSAPNISGLRFTWPADAPAAVFERNGSLWAVFDRAVSADVANNWPRTVGRPELFSSAVSSILRWPLPVDRYPALRRDGANLLVEFALTPPLPGEQIALDAQPQADGGPRVLLKSPAFGPVIETRDPDVGDKLWILPTMAAEGLTGERRFVEFQILASLQGVAVKALTDDLIVRGALEGAEIVAPGGLRLSGVLAANAPAALAAASPATTRMTTQGGASVPLPALAVNTTTLFDFAAWSQFGGTPPASFFERKANLQRAVIESPRAMRNPSRLALARFLFANGQSADALGILQVMEEDEPEVARDPAFLALRGASRYLMGDLNAAGPDLFSNSLDQEREAALWRAALLSGQNDWIAASRYFTRAESVLRAYPADLQLPFGLLAAEAALSTGDSGAAKFQLDSLGYLKPSRPWRDQIDYLRGEILLKSGETDAALAAWDRAINGLHPPSKARARLARVETMLGNKSMKLADGIAELERLRYGWRGDEVELTVLRRLGELYIEAGDYKNGLATLRDALTQFPKAPEGTAIAQRMRDSFADLYIGGLADKMPPLTALGIYEDFRDLTPLGDSGNLLIAKLADRLVQIELLDRASSLLKGQIDSRLKGAPQAEAANQLALVQLLDRKPEDALATLKAPLPADASDGLKAERRQLQARTLGELTRYPEALALLNGDTSTDAARLRAEIGWRTQNWPLAAAAFTQLVPAGDKPMSDAERQTVLRLAIAQSLSQDNNGLAAARARYGADMAKSAFKESFDLITASNIAQNFDLRSISRQVAGVDQFGAFMTGYRDKILKARAASVAQKGAQSAANSVN